MTGFCIWIHSSCSSDLGWMLHGGTPPFARAFLEWTETCGAMPPSSSGELGVSSKPLGPSRARGTPCQEGMTRARRKSNRWQRLGRSTGSSSSRRKTWLTALVVCQGFAVFRSPASVAGDSSDPGLGVVLNRTRSICLCCFVAGLFLLFVLQKRCPPPSRMGKWWVSHIGEVSQNEAPWPLGSL